MHQKWLVGTAMMALLLGACGTRATDDRFDAMLHGESPGDPGPGEMVAGVDPVTSTSPDPGSQHDEASAPVATSPDSGDDGGRAVDGAARETGPTPSEQADGSERPAQDGEGGASDAGTSVEDNTASDIGVTESSIKVGNIVSISGPLGENAFGPSFFGANAYFTYLNQAKGGIHGRSVEFLTCDDAEDASRNLRCAQDLVESQEVFAFVSNNTRAYAAAEYVSDRGVPDIMGQPIGDEYLTYPTLYSILGSNYERDGVVGDDGQLYAGALAARFVREHFGGDTAAVFFFDIPISKTAGQAQAEGLRTQGYEVLEFEINPVVQNFEARVEQMRQAGVQVISDTIDINANRNLCRAMDNNDFHVLAKITTVQGIAREAADYSHPCRESLVGMTKAVPYTETSHEEVALFHDVMDRMYGGEFATTMHQWHWEGWLAARSFAQAMEEMGPAPTREGLMAHYEAQRDYTLGGLSAPIDWQPLPFGERDEFEDCLHFVQWNEGQGDFERIGPAPFCASVPFVPQAST